MILYFSGTGNSAFVAEVISKKIEDDIISLNKRIKQTDYSPIKTEKPIVIVTPTYAGRIPRVVNDFIKKVDFIGNKSVYFISTCAVTPYQSEKCIKKLCSQKELFLKGFQSIIMPQNYIVMYDIKSKHENDKIIHSSIPKIQQLAEVILNNKDFPKEAGGNGAMTYVLNPLMYSTMIKSKKFFATSNCNGCGKCVEVCPLNNVTLFNGKPKWDKNCTHCMACINSCPQKSIEYGKSTKGKNRYLCVKTDEL